MTVPAGSRMTLPRAIGTIFKTALVHWWTCLAIAVTYALLIGGANALSRSATGVVDPTTIRAGEVLAAGITALIAFLVLVLVQVLAFPVTLGALSLVGSGVVYGDRIKTGGTVRRAFGRSLEAVGAFLLVSLLLVVPIVALGVVSLVVGYFAGPETGFSVLNVLSIVLSLPLLYLFVRWSLAIPAVMREGLGPISALRRSWQLTRGHWWWVFAVTLVPLAVAVLNFVLSFLSFIGPDRVSDFLGGAAISALCALVSVILYGIATGVGYAVLAPEDVSPPEVVASEARVVAATGDFETPTPVESMPPPPVEPPPAPPLETMPPAPAPVEHRTRMRIEHGDSPPPAPVSEESGPLQPERTEGENE